MYKIAPVLMALVLAPVVALAEADGPDFFRVTGVASDDVLNIRAEPSGSSAKVGELPPGTDGVRNLGCEGGLSFAEWQEASEAERAAAERRRWCRIAFGGTEGWVAGRFLEEGAAPQGLAATLWRIAEIDGGPALGTPEFRFARDGSVGGSTGCNRFAGGGTVRDGTLTIPGPLAVTRMACAEAGIDAQERRVLELLASDLALSFDPFSGRLHMIGGDGGMTLEAVGVE